MFGDTKASVKGSSIKKLCEIADIVSGITKGRKSNDANLISVPYMAVSNVKEGYIDWTTVKTIEATAAEIERYHLESYDILITEGGDPDKVGRGALIINPPQNCIHQNHIFRVRLNRDVLPYYFESYLRTHLTKKYFLSCAKQTTGIASINMKQLKALPVLIPPIEEQFKFTSYVHQADKSKLALKQIINELQCINLNIAALLLSVVLCILHMFCI